MHDPRVVVFGYGDPGVAALETLADLGTTPVALVVPSNRQNTNVARVAAAAAGRGCRVLTQPARAGFDAFLDDLRGLQPHLVLVWSYTMILPPALIELPPLGAVNVHGGLLPQYRGGHVMQWAIINGESETGVALHYMDAGIDTGPIIAQRRFPLAATDDAASVQEKLVTFGRELLRTWWSGGAPATAPRAAQDESRARYFRMRTAEDGRIDWSAPNNAIDNLVRALVAPWPGAFTSIAGTKLVVRRSRPVPAGNGPAEPGAVIRCDDHAVIVATGSGALQLLSIEVDGRAAGLDDLGRAGFAPGVRLDGSGG
jgi:methionyl-tRNA formyltransferase